MAPATQSAVLGNFDDATFADATHRARFHRDHDRFLIDTDSGDGHTREFAVAFTFGVYPLQQYLVRAGAGRLQAFDIAWDTRPRAAGGQRWFALQTPEPPAGSPLHWTGRAYTWNEACAACHTTGLHKNFGLATNSYATTFAAAGVGCQSCHGDGARHIAWAHGALPATDLSAANKGLATRLSPALTPRFTRTAPDQPIAAKTGGGGGSSPDICFACHARREALVDDPPPGTPFLDAYRPALLDPALYENDGRNKGEVFEYGAFQQSRMARAGVTCSNCHDPHSLALKAPGNALCAQCHNARVFDVPGHAPEARRGGETACVACHMPVRTYMGVHQRHDHGFRVPAAPRFAAAFAAARAGAPAVHRLGTLLDDGTLPGIVRATAATLLAGTAERDGVTALRAAASDPDPLVRMGVAQAASDLPDAVRCDLLAPLLADPIRAVRVAAAEAGAGTPGLAGAGLDRAIAEFLAATAANADRPEAHASRAALALRLGNVAAARGELHTAHRLAPDYVPALLNLADLERAAGDEAAAGRSLRAAQAADPHSPEPLDALALQALRAHDLPRAGALLTTAATLAPDDAQTVSLAALAAAEEQHPAEAYALLARALASRPDDLALLALAIRFAPDSATASRHLRHVNDLRDRDNEPG